MKVILMEAKALVLANGIPSSLVLKYDLLNSERSYGQGNTPI
jgi:hypothetical protein